MSAAQPGTGDGVDDVELSTVTVDGVTFTAPADVADRIVVVHPEGGTPPLEAGTGALRRILEGVQQRYPEHRTALLRTGVVLVIPADAGQVYDDRGAGVPKSWSSVSETLGC